MGATHARDQIYKALVEMTVPDTAAAERLKCGLVHLNFVVHHEHDAESIGEKEWVALRDACNQARSALDSSEDSDSLASATKSCVFSLLEAYGSISRSE